MLVFVLFPCRRAIFTPPGCRPGAGLPGCPGSSVREPVLFSSVGEFLHLKTLMSKEPLCKYFKYFYFFRKKKKKYRKIFISQRAKVHGFIFLKSEEKQLITSAARLQAVGAGRGRGNAGLGAGLTAGRSPGAGWPPRPPEAAAGGRGAALWRPGRELPPCLLRAGRAEPSRLRPGPPWARCSAGSRCAWRSSSCRAARRTSA